MDNPKVAVVIVAASESQYDYIWPSYEGTYIGMAHDLIIVHTGNYKTPSARFVINKIHNINKIQSGHEIPHRAFGAYRHAFEKFKNEYDMFVFVSDDVFFKRDCWLHDIYKSLYQHPKIGFGASQVFNGNKGYPHSSHLRAPLWFAKTECLSKASWEFTSDHDGEMRIGDQLTDTGYFGIQVGNKINLGYDIDESDHITQIMENTFFPNHSRQLFTPFSYDYFENLKDDLIITSPYGHIGDQKVLSDIEPFDNLIYYPSLSVAKKHCKTQERKGAHILCQH